MKGPTKNQTSSSTGWLCIVLVHLKNEFTEDDTYHNLMSWLV